MLTEADDICIFASRSREEILRNGPLRGGVPYVWSAYMKHRNENNNDAQIHVINKHTYQLHLFVVIHSLASLPDPTDVEGR